MVENNNDDYPLNCIDQTGDGFSGWFAISNPRQCNDFCYWNLPNDNTNNSNSNSSSHYAAWNTADPHPTTVIHTPIGTTVYWTCIYDSANDEITISNADGQSWIESWEKYSSRDGLLQQHAQDGDGNVPFPYLRCQKGAGERLKTWSGEAVKSAAFWESWIVLASLIIVGEFMAMLFFYKRGKMRYDQVLDLELSREAERDAADCHESVDQVDHDDREVNDTSSRNDNSRDDEFIEHSHSSSFMAVHHVRPRCKYCTPLASFLCKDPRKLRRRLLYSIRILLVVVLNLLLAFTISLSSISLMEINANPHFSEGMQKLTPACSDPSLVCPAGNEDIDRQSAQWPPIESVNRRQQQHAAQRSTKAHFPDTTKSTTVEAVLDHDDVAMQPFSYLMASDAQLYWFNGEFAEMGEKPLPSSCSPSDSCGRCTGKHGLNTNIRLQKAWESLMGGKADGMNATDDLPIPKTLVMNGDLTAYFHPYQKQAYESIYNNIDGLEHYFPSLGNHDVEHGGGGMYGGDEWVGGLPNCNAEHAIGYFKSAFCGQIPAFDTDRIVRYDSSSLAYSWDEGRYHFVHSHYYPSYEMASMKYHSSLEWLERDLQMAHDAGLTTILFVHAAQGLVDAMEDIILGKNVKAIIAGHTHRCLHRKCEGVYPLNEDQVKNLESLDFDAEKCIPAAYDTCQILSGENLIYAKDMGADVTFPEEKLHNYERKDKPLCPKPAPIYINETDNSMLCHRVTYSNPNFPFESGQNSTESIPIFWSGSSSFETFMRGDFFEDRIVINAMKVSVEGEVARYVDLHTVPNAVYPYHEVSDVEETVIYL